MNPAQQPSQFTDRELIERVLEGDEDAFANLVGRHQARLLRIAGILLPSVALAEELVQDSWMVALDQLSKFEGRSSFKTWITAIVSNRARNLAAREKWTVSFSSSADSDEPVVPPDRFTPSGASWARPPTKWAPDFPETVVRRAEARDALSRAIEALPTTQRAVVMLRDVEGLSTEEVCEALMISAANQRVLLHRGRARLRNLLEGYADGI